MPLSTYSHKTGKLRKQFFYIQLTRDRVSKIVLCQILNPTHEVERVDPPCFQAK